MKIVFTGGGTAGHILPIVAVTREIKRIYPKDDLALYYVGPKDDFGEILLTQEGIKIRTVLAGKIRRYLNFLSLFQNIFDILVKIPLGILQSFFYMFFLGPDLIFSKGGFGSFPAVISGKILGVNVFLHEADVVPGMANKFLSKIATGIFVSFEPKKIGYISAEKMIWTGNPIRREILEGTSDKAREIFKLSGQKPVLLVLGGSQGAQKINDMILEILPFMLSEFEVIHQCGEKNFKEVSAEAKIMITPEMEKYYHLYSFLKENELKHAYAATDIVASRAGASSIFEIAAMGKPSILIPLSGAAQDHQSSNAYAFAEKGACLVIEESNLTPHFFLEKLKFLIERPNELEKMKNAAKEFSKPEAAKIIAQYILKHLI